MSNATGFCRAATSWSPPGVPIPPFVLLNNAWLLISIAFLNASLLRDYRHSYESARRPLQRLLLSSRRQLGTDGREQQPRPLVLPRYALFSLFTAFSFAAQAFAGLLADRGSLLHRAAVCVALVVCTTNDSMLQIHCMRATDARTSATLVLALLPGLAVLALVLLLPGPIGACDYCGEAQYAKQGMEYGWGVAFVLNAHVALCGEMRWRVAGPWCAKASPRPRASIAPWALLMCAPYALATAGLLILRHVHAADSDLGHCCLGLADLCYTMGYVPTFLHVVRLDSAIVRAAELQVVLDETLHTSLNSSLRPDAIVIAPSSTATTASRVAPAEAGSDAPQQLLYDVLTDPRIHLIDAEQLQLTRRLGGGGFGDVHLATWRRTPVAVKRLHAGAAAGVPTLVGGAGGDGARGPLSVRQALLEEARLLSSLRHPNVNLFLGVALTRDHASLVTEYMSGGDMRAFIDAHGLDRTLRRSRRALLLDAARGMDYLHGLRPRPVLHRDLKSANLLLDAPDASGTPRLCKVADFGLSSCRDAASATGGGGTPSWSSPEHLRGEAFAPPSDVFSFGVVVWETLTAAWPHAQLRPLQAAHQIAYGSLTLTLPPPEAGEEEEEEEEDVEEEEERDGESEGLGRQQEGAAQRLRCLFADCCAAAPDARPPFGSIVERLEKSTRYSWA